MKNLRKAWSLAGAPLIFTLSMAPAGDLMAATSIQFRFGTVSRPLSGWRYDQMRSLAHYLDGQANRALVVARQTARPGDWSQMRMIQSMRSFRKCGTA